MMRNQRTRVGFFEIISTYFVKMYYNYLYDEAVKKTKASNNLSITLNDEYRKAIVAFKESLTRNPKYYYDTVKDIWATFQLVSPITLPDFIDTVVKLFIPESYHEDLINEKLRDRYMGNLLLTMVSEFSTRINEVYVDKITNEKDRGKYLINQLQDDFNNILEIIRTNMSQKLTGQAIKSNASMPVEAFNKMKLLLATAIDAKNDAEMEVQNLKNKLAATNEYKKKIMQLETENSSLKTELAKYKKKSVSEYIDATAKTLENNKKVNISTRPDNIIHTAADNGNSKKTLSSFITNDDVEVEDDDDDAPLNAKQAFAKRQSIKANQK
jgi:FtsZ-binding cell division protein ZapB